MAAEGSLPFDAVALDQAEKQFWRGLWDAACEDAVVDLGIDMVEFGPVSAAVVAEEAAEPALNFVLGAGAPGALEDGYLPAAVQWMERHDVDFRVPVIPGLPEQEAAERWLQRHRYRLLDGPVKLIRNGEPPRERSLPGIEIYERTDPWEDESFGDPLAESLGFPNWAATFFLDLPGSPDWHCYCAVDGDEPLAYVAMRFHQDVAVLALASRLAGRREGLGQNAVLHRCINDAVAAGCSMMVIAEAGSAPALADRKSILGSGFRPIVATHTWQPRARVHL
ncbi:MAG TPA: hypothetical protein VG816_09940 [Solirubrobacterales bacterium]|nr:hypothetical protein [Solirubrobacterales bacterium]